MLTKPFYFKFKYLSTY